MISVPRLTRPAVLEAWADALDGTLSGGYPKCEVTGVADDSREVERGTLFVARPGATTSGRAYAAEAAACGAAAVVTDDPGLDAAVPLLRVEDVLVALRRAGDLWYGHPQTALDLVGITGTKGKTTTAWLTAAALRNANHPTAVFGTIAHDVGDGIQRPARNTTPGLLELRRLLAAARDQGCRCAVMEVSSHALDQGRADGLDFAVAVFTNLGRDHSTTTRTSTPTSRRRAGCPRPSLPRLRPC